MTRALLISLLLFAAGAAIAAATAATGPALLGLGIAAGTALASIGGIGLLERVSGRPVQDSLAVFAVMFLVRLLLVALGLVAVVKAGASVLAFIAAFFTSYFAFVAVEAGYLRSLARRTGKAT